MSNKPPRKNESMKTAAINVKPSPPTREKLKPRANINRQEGRKPPRRKKTMRDRCRGRNVVEKVAYGRERALEKSALGHPKRKE
jgi:hypothetical protein